MTADDYLGPRAVIAHGYKLVVHEKKGGGSRRELFHLDQDPTEKTDLLAARPEVADRLQGVLTEWQKSVLHSLTGADYAK